MAVKLVCLLLVAGILPVRTMAQVEQVRITDVVVKVYVDSFQNQATAGITVQIQNGFGSVQQEGRTDSSGMIQFHTTTGIHRLRIYGPGIQEYNETFEIELVETRHTENAVVRAKAAEHPGTGNVPGSGMISADRLKIPEKAHKEFEKGSEALGQKAWSEAKKHFDAAIALYREYDVAYNGLGIALMNSDDTQGARSAFEKAISLNDAFAEAYRNLARISLSEKKYDEADTLLVKSLSSDPLNARALTYAANAELLTHKYNEAIEHARKAHTVPHEGFAGVHIIAGLALEALQQPIEATKEYQLYLAEDPKGRDAPNAQKAIARLGSPAAK